MIYTGKVTLTFDMFADGKDANEAVREMYTILNKGFTFYYLTGLNVNAKPTIERVRMLGGAY